MAISSGRQLVLLINHKKDNFHLGQVLPSLDEFTATSKECLNAFAPIKSSQIEAIMEREQQDSSGDLLREVPAAARTGRTGQTGAGGEAN